MQIEKIQFENRETMITMDGLKEANSELTAELDDVKHQLLDAKISVSETSAALNEKEKKKAERMAQMMTGFDVPDGAVSENEQRTKDTIAYLDELLNLQGDEDSAADLRDLRSRLSDLQQSIHQNDAAMAGRGEDETTRRREALEDRLATVEQQYEQLLEGHLSPDDVEDVKRRLGDAYVGSKTLQQQIADFDQMKKSLMRDLQNRCERVVELEISLDETREQYNNVLRTSNNRAQQKKMAFLERNLEQLTHIQRQLVDQNNSLKKEVAIAERKLIARNDRIQSLETLLQDSQEKLTAANHRHVSSVLQKILTDNGRFEAQLMQVKERLEAAKAGSSRGIASTATNGGFNLSGYVGSRIAKPLRGGGVETGAAAGPTVANLQQEGTPSKRGSWLPGRLPWPSGNTGYN